MLTILFSDVYAGYESVLRLVHPQAFTRIGLVAIAVVIGLLGNEAVAPLPIPPAGASPASPSSPMVSMRIGGFTYPAVLAGAAGVWKGYPLADPVVEIAISLTILLIFTPNSRNKRKCCLTEATGLVRVLLIKPIHYR